MQSAAFVILVVFALLGLSANTVTINGQRIQNPILRMMVSVVVIPIIGLCFLVVGAIFASPIILFVLSSQ